MTGKTTRIADLLAQKRDALLTGWVEALGGETSGQLAAGGNLRQQASEFLTLLSAAVRDGASPDLGSPAWAPVRQFLDSLSASRVRQGFTSMQTATFIFSLKKPLFVLVREAMGSDADGLARETLAASELIDQLGLHTVSAFQAMRESVITRQQTELLELSTPVVKLWDGILALPMIGTLDSARTQVVMEQLLQRIVDTGSEIAILDITGVPTVDTLVAQHLLKTVTAIRLMGGDCIISGVRPQIAQTIVTLGVDLTGVTTKATLADALALAFQKTGKVVSSRSTRS